MLDFDGLFPVMKQILVKTSSRPIVEVDWDSHSAYVRFKRQAKVFKTVPVSQDRMTMTVDLDRNGDVIGVEMVGVREFSLHVIREHIHHVRNVPRVDWDHARFVPVGAPELAA